MVGKSILKLRTGLAVAAVMAMQMIAGNAKGQVVYNGGASNVYTLGSNWTGGSIPGTTAWAQYGSVGSNNTQLIVMNGSNNNGSNNQAVGAIEATSARGLLLQIGASNANGILTLNGATVNGVSNVILWNSATFNLQFPTSSPSLRFSVPGTTNRNIVTAPGSSSTLIGSTIAITDTITSSAPFTFLGGGTWNGSTGNAGGLWKLNAGGQNFSGGVTVGKSDGTEVGVFEIDAVNTLLNTSGNNVTVNPFSELYLNSATGTFNTTNITLTLNGTGNPVTLTTPGGALVQKLNTSYNWNGPITLASDASILTIGSGTLTASGNISGSGKLIKRGSVTGASPNGQLLLTGTSNSWSGGTEIRGGVISVGSSSSISTTGLLLNSIDTNTSIVFNNSAQTLTSIASSFTAVGTRTQTITLSSGHTLTLNQNTNTTYGSNGTTTTQTSIIAGAGALIKNGTGTLTLTSNANTLSGGLTINNGEIRFNPRLTTTTNMSSCPVTLNGGSITTTGDTTTAQISLGVLTLTANSTIDLGTATTHNLKFANSSAASWTGSTILNVTNWTGAFNGTAGTKGKLFIGTTSAGVTAGQLAQIQFTDGSGNVYPAAILSTGEIVPKASITTTVGSFGPFSNASSHVISVPFTTSGPFSANFKVQLSGPTGTFTADTTTGVIGTGATSPISATIPAAITAGGAYRLRVISGTPNIIFGTDNGSNISILAPNPTVTSVTPNSGIPGSSVTIAGTNFNTTGSSNTVYFGAVKGTVTSSGSTTSLTVTVPVGATFDHISVLNTAIDLTGYQRLSFTPTYVTTHLATGQINFSAHQDFSTGAAPFISIMGDIDGDGKSDMITANSSAGTLSVFRNTSAAGAITAGSFGSPSSLSTASTPTNVRFADVDGDGRQDLIVVSAAAATVSVFRNTSSSGSISFASRVDYSTTASGLAPIEVTVADYDGDGMPEMAVSASFSNTIIVFQNASSPGTINFGTGVAFAANTGAFGITSADFDGDGKVDIAAVDTGSATVSVFRNTSTTGTINSGSFATAVDFSTGTTPIDVEAADIDGDGKIDILATNSTSGTVSVLRNTATAGSITAGSFGTSADFSVGTNPSGVAVGDIDGDGKVDIAASNSASNTVTVFRNTSSSGSISLATGVAFATANGPQGLSIGDLDGDGKPDIAVAAVSANVVSVLRNFRLPNVAAITGTITLCPGASVTLSDATSGGTWSNNNPAISSVSGGVVYGLSAGTDTVTYTVIVSGDTTIVFTPVTVNASSDAGTVSGSSPLCVAASTTFTTSGAAGGTWSSSNTSVASVDATTGDVTGVAAGTTTISYAVTGACGTAVATHGITISPLPNAGTISGVTALCAGASSTLTTTGTGGSWSSSSTSIATIVSGSGFARGVAAGSATYTYSVTNSCGSDYTTSPITVNPLPDAGTVSGAATLCAASSTTFTASGSTGGTWTSSNPSRVTVDASTGSVTGISATTATISYSVTNSCGTDVATQNITINALPNAGTISGASAVCPGANTTLTTSGSAGSWSTSASSTASVGSSSGIVYGVAAGSATITYTATNGCGSDYSTAAITVNPLPDAGTVSGTSPLCVAASATFTASGFAGGTWASSNTARATVDVSTGSVTGAAAGALTISYTVTNGCGSDVATQSLTITALPDAGTISGVSTLCSGSSVTFSNSAGSGTWSTSASSIASVNSATGTVYGVAVGSATISYTVTTSCGTASTSQGITIGTIPSAPASITGTTVISLVGGSTTLSDATSGGSWSSSNTAIATVDASGVVTATGFGTATISYAVSNSCGSTYVTTTVTVSSSNHAPSYRNAGGTVALCQDAVRFPITELLAVRDLDTAQTITWSVVTAPAHGTAVIDGTRPSNGFIVRPVGTSYTPNAGYSGVDTMVLRVSDGLVSTTATFYLNVNALPAVPAISGATSVCHGGTATLIASPSGGVWSSMDGNATIGASTGIITGVGGPVGVINYLSPYNAYGCRSQVRTTIPILSYPATGTITGSSIVCPGSTTSLSESVTGGTWTSSNTALATVSGSGAVTGVSSGTLTISYTVSNSCASAVATTIMNVGGATNPSVVAGGTYVCIGSTITYSNALSGGSWSSTNTSVANVSGSGVVSPVAVGTATIIYSYTNGCGITRTASKAVTVYDLPNTGTITGPSTVTRGTVISLTTSGVTSGTWYRSTSSSSVLLVSGSGTTGRVYGVAPGTANVYYTASNTCGTATSSYSVSVTAGRSENGSVVAEGTESNDIAVFPNPTSGIVTVQIPGTGSSDINVTDMSGKVVVMQNTSTNKADLDLSSLSPGVYQIVVNNGVQVFTTKVVLK